jgi:hypothetical protein
VDSKHNGWIIYDKPRLLLALMEELASNASRMSFEGKLEVFNILSFPGARREETDILKRHTIWPKQDFVIVPLEPLSASRILAATGGRVPRRVVHMQIERAGVLEFGAYDSFDPDCLFFGPAIKGHFLAALVELGILQSAVKARK